MSPFTWGSVGMSSRKDCQERSATTVCASGNENDFSEVNGKSQKTVQIPKKEFQWLAEEQAYHCPEGKRLVAKSTTRLERSNGRFVVQTTCRCPAEHCICCPRRESCTPSFKKGLAVSRLEHEDLVDALRARMETAEAKELYRLRRQTIELRYGDLKQHRHLRRFSHYGPRRARAQIGAAVLAYNLLISQKNRKCLKNPSRAPENPQRSPILKGGRSLNGPAIRAARHVDGGLGSLAILGHPLCQVVAHGD
jgi:hypothetical protein